MEGETEKEPAEEKESDDTGQSGEEEEGGTRHHKTSECAQPDQDLPIMHWEDLSLRIAELEKQEEERRERAKSASGSELLTGSEGRKDERRGGARRQSGEDEVEPRSCRVTVITSRFTHHKNLQLCYINNSESDEEEAGTCKEGSTGASSNGYHPSGLKQEVKVALRALRDKLWAEQKEKEHLTSCTAATRRTHLDLIDLQLCSLQHLLSLRVSLGQEVQDLSSELVCHLLERDQLRTKQDAMLMDVQDLT
ncbi:schwannomin-interacting protein 1 [Osmerus mordax]|uniref:schwannomin-interacting protein 1 n=1 Tax=Osmerus mordax TaxID=8014 RepID=UPI00350F899D